jgi:hypothetical protein
MYTRGKGHRDPCVCFRDEVYEYMQYHRTRREEIPVTAQGFGFENVMAEGEVDLYISGHEHAFQHHFARNILHVICGNSGADVRRGLGLYGGENKEQEIDWIDKTNTPGFVEFRVTRETITVNFVSQEAAIFHSVTRTKS